MKQQQITFLRDLALAQVYITKKYDGFENYQKEMFPWMETAKRRERSSDIQRLMEEVKRGPLQVTAQAVPSVKSRLAHKAKSAVPGNVQKQQNDLYKKLGSSF